MEYVINYLLSLSPLQSWFVLLFLSCIIIYIFYLIREHGIPYKGEYLFKSKKDGEAENALPDYLQAKVWIKDSYVVPVGKKKKIKVGQIGFIKDVTIFKFFGTYWNSASKEGKEGYALFASEFKPPAYLTEEQQKEMECFVFVENCKPETKLFAIVKKNSEFWRKIYVVALEEQIASQQLESLLKENGAPDNIEIIEIPPYL